jgi:hypothetical protein
VSLCQHLSSIILLLTKESCELMSTLVLHHFITDQRVMWAYVNTCPPSFYYWPKSHVSLCQHLSSIILLLTKESCELMSTLVPHHFITDQRVMWAYVNTCPPSFYYWPKSHVSLCQHLSSIINISHFDLSSEITWLIETKLGWNDGCRVIFRNSSDNMTARDNLSFWLVKCKKKSS